MTSGELSRMAAQYPRWLSVRRLMEYADFPSQDAVYLAIKRGLPAVRTGAGGKSHYRFDRFRVDAWLEEHAVNA